MSRARPSQRDLLEREFLRLAKERSAAAERVEKLDAELVRLQGMLERAESGGPAVRGEGARGREDAIDRLNQGALRPAVVVVEELRLPEEESLEVAGEIAAAGDEVNWRARCGRLTAFVVGILREIVAPGEKQPKLKAFEGLYAIGADCESMQTVARLYGLTVERISQRAEATRERFNLPKNQHNKSERAVSSYRATAHITKGAAA